MRTSLADSSHLTGFLTISKEKINETKAAEIAHNFHFHFNIKNLDGDYETNLWDYRFLRPLKQLKSKITFNLFNRTYVDALVSPDGKYLLYQSTVDTSFIQSSYRPIEDKELKTIITSLNVAYDHYKRLGFRKSPEKDKLYQRSDTHWTRFGSMVWLNEFNRQMASRQ